MGCYYVPQRTCFLNRLKNGIISLKKKKVLRQISFDQNMKKKANQRKIFCYDSKRCIQTFELYSIIYNTGSSITKSKLD